MGKKELAIPQESKENSPETIVFCYTCGLTLYQTAANNWITRIVAEERALDHKRFWGDEHQVVIMKIDPKYKKI